MNKDDLLTPAGLGSVAIQKQAIFGSRDLLICIRSRILWEVCTDKSKAAVACHFDMCRD